MFSDKAFCIFLCLNSGYIFFIENYYLICYFYNLLNRVILELFHVRFNLKKMEKQISKIWLKESSDD